MLPNVLGLGMGFGLKSTHELIGGDTLENRVIRADGV